MSDNLRGGIFWLTLYRLQVCYEFIVSFAIPLVCYYGWLFQSLSEPNLALFRNSKFGQNWIRIWMWGELVLGSQNNTSDVTNDINNAVSCYKETVQFCASFVTLLLVLANFWRNSWNGSGFYIFIVLVTLTEIANASLDRSAALVLSIINRTYCSCTCIRQIRPEIRPEQDLYRFPKNGQISELLELEPKSGRTLLVTRAHSFLLVASGICRCCLSWDWRSVVVSAVFCYWFLGLDACKS